MASAIVLSAAAAGLATLPASGWRAYLSGAPLVLRLDAGPPARRLGGRLFQKEVARVGSWTHPATGRPVVFTRADLEEIAAETNRYATAIGGVRFPSKHDGVWIDGKQPDATDNLGRWLSFHVDGDILYGVAEAADDKVAEMLGGRIRGVSLCLVPEAKDSHGGIYRRVLDHVAATPEPVLDHQRDFVPLTRAGSDASEARAPVYRLSVAAASGGIGQTERKEPVSKIKEIAESLGLAYTTDDETAEAIKAKLKLMQGEKDAAMAESKSKAAAALSATAEVASAKGETDKAKGEAQALSTRVKELETREKERDDAERDAAIAEVKALAAKAGKPEALAPEDETEIKGLWAPNRKAALRMLAMARSAIGPVATEAGGKVVVAKADADKATATDKAKRATDDLDTKIVMARSAGAQIKRLGDKVVAVRPDKVEVPLN